MGLAEGYLFVSFTPGKEDEVLRGLEATRIVVEVMEHNATTWVVKVVGEGNQGLHDSMDKVGSVPGITDVNLCLAPPRKK